MYVYPISASNAVDSWNTDTSPPEFFFLADKFAFRPRANMFCSIGVSGKEITNLIMNRLLSCDCKTKKYLEYQLLLTSVIVEIGPRLVIEAH
jgi:hypothetical protein